jgi:outer membrane protein insertion porin family
MSCGAISLCCVRPPVLCLVLMGAALVLAQAPAPASPGAAANPPSSSSVSTKSFEGRTISRIDYDPESQPLPRAELDRILPLHPGQPIVMDEVRAALQKLYLTGRYTDVTVDAEPERAPDGAPDGAGVALRIITTPSFFVGGVSIEGEDDPPNRNQLAAATKLELGAPFLSTEVETAVTNMQDRLRANGFYQSRIQYRVERNPDTEEASIHFDIDTGDRARFGGVKLPGPFSADLDRVIRTTRWRKGFGPLQFPGWRQVTENRVQSGIQRVQKDFQKGDHLEAKVSLEMLDYERDTNRVTPNLTIDSGPVIEVRVQGAKISGGRLRQLVPVYQERSVDQGLLVEGRRNILEYVQGLGYFDAQVQFDQPPPAPDRTQIEYTVALGARHKVAEIEIAGNRFFDTPTIRERMYVLPASWFRRYGRYSERLLEQDKDAIRDLYRASGFREADVMSTVEETRPDRLSVKLQIVEGPQWFVNRLELEGALAEDAAHLQSVLQSVAGQPFSEASVAADRESVLSYYYNNGYPDATFDWTESPAGDEPNRIDLKYTIRPGKRQFVRGILVRGLENANPALVSNRITLAPGDPISQSRMGESQQKLYDLGIFSKVQTALQNPEGDEDSKYVLVDVDEARKYSFNAGLGASLARIGGGVTTFDAPAGETGFVPRVSLGMSRIDFLGLGHTIGVQTLASTVEQRVVFTYLAPQFRGNENLALSFSGLFDDSYDVRTFVAHRWEGSVQLAQKLARARSFQYRYTYRHVSIDQNSLKISPELIPLLSQPDRAGLLGFSFIQDHRDDPTNSRRGSLNTVDVGVAWKWFGSETDFTRVLVRNSTYYPIGRDIVIARSLQFGYIQQLGGLSPFPLAERFFSGGVSSQRAFPDNQAGPRDLETGFPLGGNALLFHNTELRFPLIGENVGGVLFHDMGNVYSDIDHVSFRFRQENLQDFNYMVQSVGFGIRYRTPVGPIRVDFSLSPNSPRFFGFQGTRDQLLAGQGVLTNQRINIFQFHFSLGQTF